MINKKMENLDTEEAKKVSGGYITRDEQADGTFCYSVRSNVTDEILSTNFDDTDAGLELAANLDKLANATSEPKKPKNKK